MGPCVKFMVLTASVAAKLPVSLTRAPSCRTRFSNTFLSAPKASELSHTMRPPVLIVSTNPLTTLYKVKVSAPPS